MSFSDMDYWRLSEFLSVTNAAMLAADIDPGAIESTEPSYPIGGHFHKRGTSNKSENYFQSPKFVAVFSAIRNSVLSNKLPANLARRSRAAPQIWLLDDTFPETPNHDEDAVAYDALLCLGGGSFSTNAIKDDFGRFKTVLYLKEPDWNESMVSVDELKIWMKGRSFLPPFFFPTAKAEGFRNPEHSRYSPKLACAVAAWEAVTKPQRNKSVKATVYQWVQTNGVNYGLIDRDGILSASAVEEIAKIVNWDTKGGAIPTGGDAEPDIEELLREADNFEKVSVNLRDERDDSDIPF